MIKNLANDGFVLDFWVHFCLMYLLLYLALAINQYKPPTAEKKSNNSVESALTVVYVQLKFN